MKKWTWKREWTWKILASVLLTALVGFLLFYIFLPPLNPRAVSFWVYVAVVLLFAVLPFLDINPKATIFTKHKVARRRGEKRVRFMDPRPLLLVAVPVLVLCVGGIISGTFFHARQYADVITVKESDFATDLPETSEITNIALMDTESAKMLGNRTLGSLSDVVSQYTVRPSYTQINYLGTPKKVTNLAYDGFFKWIGNRKSGIPGMVMVDPVNSSAEYIRYTTPVKYAESAYFGEDLERYIRFRYPTKIIDSISFEIDEEGKPFYIISCSTPRVALFGASDISEVIVLNPCDGSSELFDIAEVPSWIDIVYTGDLAMEKYDWHGMLSGGFWNSVIGNKGCKISTDDFGYVALEDDVWYFTGVTSAVADDKSNIGFILTNARTGVYKFYAVIGAEEHSAMSAAEGEVQEKGYVASFPSLVNVSGQASYIMVLKDEVGLVKLYALVNVENYSIVATGATQTEAMSAYKKLLAQSDIDIGVTDETEQITVENVRLVDVAGVATVYITATDGIVYKGYLEADESLILVRAGDSLQVGFTESGKEHIRIITSWTFADEG